MATVVSIWAHPDDEAFGPSGLVRLWHDTGIRNVLITATCGEGGNVGNPPLTTKDTLGAVRTQELQCACDVIGFDQLFLWDYPDGGLKDVDAQELRDRILPILETEQADVVLTFGPDGIYGHPDHIAIHSIATQAFAQYLAKWQGEVPPRLYYVTPHPDMVETQTKNAAAAEHIPAPLPPTAILNVADYKDVKLAALKCHATQHEDWQQALEHQSEAWLTCVYLHRAYPPTTEAEEPETNIFP